MARRGIIDRMERFLRRHEGSGGAAIIGLMLILVVVGILAIMALRAN